MKRILSIVLLTTMLANLTGCGTVLHPERKGQISGDYDLNIVILNGIGLIFFIIPGVIAYAVDLNNGTIYLPRGQGQNIGRLSEGDKVDTSNMYAMRMERDQMTEASIRAAVEKHSGRKIPLENKKMEVYAVDDKGITKRVYPHVTY